MDAYGGFPSGNYHQPSQWTRRDDEIWNTHPNPRSLPLWNEIGPLQRYLHEPDQPWYNPGSFDECPLDTIQQPIYANPSAWWYQEPVQYPHPAPPRCDSPGLPSPPSTYHSRSDRQSIPWSPPTTPHYSPEMAHQESVYMPFGGCAEVKQELPCASGNCVALNEIQQYADTLPEDDAYECEPVSYLTLNVQEGYAPMGLDHGQANGVYTPNTSTSQSDTQHRSQAPRFRRRQAADSRSIHSTNASKVKKRTSNRKRTQIKADPDTYSDYTSTPTTNRAFPCPFRLYGCRASFGSKNEWKRHINTQHMRLTFWRCDLCSNSSKRPNDFNRKDLFIQHVRRMHPPPKTSSTKSSKSKSNLGGRPSKHDPHEQQLVAIAHRCFQNTRPSPDQSGCLFCEEKFSGPSGWDERLEHIGKHMEIAKRGVDGGEGVEGFNPADTERWWEDPELEVWLEREGIIVSDGEGFVLADGVEM